MQFESMLVSIEDSCLISSSFLPFLSIVGTRSHVPREILVLGALFSAEDLTSNEFVNWKGGCFGSAAA